MTTFHCSVWNNTHGRCCPDGTICPNCPGETVDDVGQRDTSTGTAFWLSPTLALFRTAPCQAATAARRSSGAPAQASAARRGAAVSAVEVPQPRHGSLTRFMVALLLGGLLLALFGSLALMTTRLAEIEQQLTWEARV